MRIAWVGGGVAAVALALDLATVSAQSLQPPTRSTPVRRTAGANQLEQQLIVEGDLFGGYDDNLNLTSTSDPFVQHPGGALGYAEADLRYSIQKRDNGLNLNGRAYWNTYSNVGASSSYGVEQSVHARTTLGRKTRIEVNEGVRYVPFFTLGAFGSLTTATAGNTPDANPVNGLFQTRSTFADASGSIRQELTRRLALTGMYAFADSNYANSTFSDSRGHRGSVVLDKVLGRTDSINATYSRAFDTFHDPTGNRDVLADTLQGGYQYRRQVSRTRQLSVGVGGGAIHVDTTTPVIRAPLDYWLPSAYLSARLDLSRSWNLSGDYRHTVQMIEGVNPQPFTSHITLLMLGGRITSRIESVISTGYSTGLSAGLVEGTYDTFSAGVQGRIRLSHAWYSVLNFNHIQNNLNAASSILLGVPKNVDHNTVRVGITWVQPLIDAPERRQPREPLRH